MLQLTATKREVVTKEAKKAARSFAVTRFLTASRVASLAKLGKPGYIGLLVTAGVSDKEVMPSSTLCKLQKVL